MKPIRTLFPLACAALPLAEAGAPAQCGQTIQDDTVKFARIIKSAGIRVE